MVDYEYKTVALPAANTRRKQRRRQSLEDVVALDLEILLNEHGTEGWQFWSLETVSALASKGLMGGTEARQVAMAIFRRPREGVSVITSVQRAQSPHGSMPPLDRDQPVPTAPRLGGANE